MTSGPFALSPTQERATSSPRLEGVAELAITGGITLVLFPLAFALRRTFGLDDAELAVSFAAFYAAWVINDPHFAVTYLLFYGDARARLFDRETSMLQRARIVLAGVVVPLALVLWAAVAVRARSAPMLGGMIQLMYLLVGWHYVKQGFGALMVLSARRGVPWETRERRAVVFHGYAAWAFAWANPSLPPTPYEEKGVIFTAIAHPRWLEVGAGAALAVSSVVLIATLARKWQRDREHRHAFPFGPLMVFLVTVWVWTIASSIDPLLRYVIPALHSIQYLYFVWLMRRSSSRAFEGPPSFGRPAAVRVGLLAVSALVLGVVLFHAGPTFLDAAFARHGKGGVPLDDLGDTPYYAAIFVFVNIHHYFMDSVIWRRENPETRYMVTS